MSRCITADFRFPRVPKDSETPIHCFRIPDDLWEEILREADDRGETATDVVLRAIRKALRD